MGRGPGTPAPFSALGAFDAPYAYSCQRNLIFDITVFGTTHPNASSPADWHPEPNWSPGESLYRVAGCATTGQSVPTLLLVESWTTIDPARVEFARHGYHLPLPDRASRRSCSARAIRI